MALPYENASTGKRAIEEVRDRKMLAAPGDE